jgi:Xaa-Pro dipeptidase
MNPYQQRLARVQSAMREWGADLLFLNYGPDFTYISGIIVPIYYNILKAAGDWISVMLVSSVGEPVLLLHPYFTVNIKQQTWIGDIRVLPDGEDPDRWLARMLAQYQPAGKTIATGKMLWGQSLLSLQAATPGARYIPATNAMLDRVRAVKDADELALMQRAAEITDAAMADTLKALKVGMSERDVAVEVDYQLRRHGGDGPSFYPGIICVGNGSDPARHLFTRNTDMKLDPGTTVAFDFGTLYQGYCSDFGRSLFVGEQQAPSLPCSDALAAYASMSRAMHAVMETMADGKTTPAQICDFVNERITADGFGPWYMYLGLGHAIGLEVHEDPWLTPSFTEPVRAGMVFTLEPKIWKPGEFYVRCEDMVLVGAERGTSLTKFSHEPNFLS